MLNQMILTEDTDLDQARVVLATRAIPDEIQKMIDKLSKLSSTHVMSISDSVTSSFDSTVSKKFVDTFTGALRDAIDALQQSKQTCTDEINSLQNIILGVSDESTDSGVTEPEADKEEPTEEETATEADKEEPTEEETATEEDLDDIFAPTAAKRSMEKKKVPESIKKKSSNIIQEVIKKKLVESQLTDVIYSILEPLAASGEESIDITTLSSQVNERIPGLFVDKAAITQAITPREDGLVKSVDGDLVYFGKTIEPIRKVSDKQRSKETDYLNKKATAKAIDDIDSKQQPVFTHMSGTINAGLSREFKTK